MRVAQGRQPPPRSWTERPTSTRDHPHPIPKHRWRDGQSHTAGRRAGTNRFGQVPQHQRPRRQPVVWATRCALPLGCETAPGAWRHIVPPLGQCGGHRPACLDGLRRAQSLNPRCPCHRFCQIGRRQGPCPCNWSTKHGAVEGHPPWRWCVGSFLRTLQ